MEGASSYFTTALRLHGRKRDTTTRPQMDDTTRMRYKALKPDGASPVEDEVQDALVVFQAEMDRLRTQLETTTNALLLLKPATELAERAEHYRMLHEKDQETMMCLGRQMAEMQTTIARDAQLQVMAQRTLDGNFNRAMRSAQNLVRSMCNRQMHSKDGMLILDEMARYYEMARLALAGLEHHPPH